MSRLQNDLVSWGATQIAIGLSAPTLITPPANMATGYLKILTGGGTLEICPNGIGSSYGSVQGASAIAGKGYYVGATEVIPLPGGPITYLVATGATMTVGLLFGFD